MAANAPSTPSRRQLREFGLLIGLVFPLLLGWLLPALHGHPFRQWTLWIGAPALVLGLAWPRALAWPYRGWMELGHALGWINSHLILGLVYVLVLQPIALAMRVFGHDPLRRRRTTDASYREKPGNSSTDMRKIF
ncbi:MAG: SxtJ family membrane protein [Cyanobacteriota bacterium]|jgi:peptidoglycan biosynthesis protein MviN/MurJ (putative lipid II flippase)